MTKNIILPNPKNLEKLKERFRKDGIDKIHVLSDFDRTLTTAFVDGKAMPSIISILRDGNYLTHDYAPKAHALYSKYHPIEINPEIPFEEKKKAMQEWWMKAFDLLTNSGFTRDDLEKVVASGKIRFRKGALEFIDLLYSHNIPLIIMSSAGLGEAISLLL
jgi:5'-nucleotidase